MALPRIATIVLTLALTAGCGGGDAVTAETPAEAVTQRMKGSAGVKVTMLVHLDYGEKAFTPPAEDDFVVPVNIGEYSESRTTGVLGATASDLTATYPMAEDKQPETTVIEIDFTGWGSDVLIDPPPSDQVHETGTCLG